MDVHSANNKTESFANFDSITLPPRTTGIRGRMARYDSLLWVMVFSFLGKWNILSLNRNMYNKVPRYSSWALPQSVWGVLSRSPQWQIFLIIATLRSRKSVGLARPTCEIYGHQYVKVQKKKLDPIRICCWGKEVFVKRHSLGSNNPCVCTKTCTAARQRMQLTGESLSGVCKYSCKCCHSFWPHLRKMRAIKKYKTSWDVVMHDWMKPLGPVEQRVARI